MIAREGYPFIGAACLLFILLRIVSGPAGWTGLVLPLAVAAFFRDPERSAPTDPRAIVSPGDGKIIEIRELEETRYLKKRARKVSIFLSILDVHINRVPCSGRVKGVFYRSGRFRFAFQEKSSEENEQNAILLEGERELLLVQIAGRIARRIVCTLKAGDAVACGQRLGLIRFGSRIDLYLPLEVPVAVAVGNRVRGGETVIGRFP